VEEPVRSADRAQVAVAYTEIVPISTDEHHELQEFRLSVGAQWTLVSDPGRTIQKDLTSGKTMTPTTIRESTLWY
jgi:hypothetical protein